MEKIIVSMKNPDAIEVCENNLLAPRYGLSQMGFQDLVVKERAAALQIERILDESHVPVLLRKINEFGAFSEDEQKDISAVLAKAALLLKDGFHVLIIRGMLACACGRKSGLGYGCFDEKFSPAYTDLDVRKDFWGTTRLLPLEFVSALLLDLVSGVYPDDLREENIRKSKLVCSCLKEKAGTLEDFIAFCA